MKRSLSVIVACLFTLFFISHPPYETEASYHHSLYSYINRNDRKIKDLKDSSTLYIKSMDSCGRIYKERQAHIAKQKQIIAFQTQLLDSLENTNKNTK